jgi:hypothetical protein
VANSFDKLKEAYDKQDWEVLHILLDNMNLSALKAIRDGHADPVKLAKTVLHVNRIYQDTPRHSA